MYNSNHTNTKHTMINVNNKMTTKTYNIAANDQPPNSNQNRNIAAHNQHPKFKQNANIVPQLNTDIGHAKASSRTRRNRKKPKREPAPSAQVSFMERWSGRNRPQISFNMVQEPSPKRGKWAKVLKPQNHVLSTAVVQLPPFTQHINEKALNQSKGTMNGKQQERKKQASPGSTTKQTVIPMNQIQMTDKVSSHSGQSVHQIQATHPIATATVEPRPMKASIYSLSIMEAQAALAAYVARGIQQETTECIDKAMIPRVNGSSQAMKCDIDDIMRQIMDNVFEKVEEKEQVQRMGTVMETVGIERMVEEEDEEQQEVGRRRSEELETISENQNGIIEWDDREQEEYNLLMRDSVPLRDVEVDQLMVQLNEDREEEQPLIEGSQHEDADQLQCTKCNNKWVYTDIFPNAANGKIIEFVPQFVCAQCTEAHKDKYTKEKDKRKKKRCQQMHTTNLICGMEGCKDKEKIWCGSTAYK